MLLNKAASRTVCIAFLLLACFIGPIKAYAQDEVTIIKDQTVTLFPIDVEEKVESNYGMIIRTYALKPDEEPSDIPINSFDKYGVRYELSEIIKKENRAEDKLTHTETITVNTPDNDMNEILKQLSQEITYEKDGYAGKLSLDISTIVCEPAGYQTSNYTLTVTREYPHLATNATPYDWFGNGKREALHAIIDDATGQITGEYMTANECLHGYFEVMKQTCSQFGVPLSVYSDKHTIFRSPKTEADESEGKEPKLTQFGRALDELGINIIHAHSPQAKGRIERLWVTLQSRLPVELRIRGITTIEEANVFLINEYIPAFNAEFGVPPVEDSLFVPYRNDIPLSHIFCVKQARKMDNAGVFSFGGVSFRVLDEGYPLIPAKASITVLADMDGGVRAQYKNHTFNTIICQKPISAGKANKRANAAEAVMPHLRHGSDEWKAVWHF